MPITTNVYMNNCLLGGRPLRVYVLAFWATTSGRPKRLRAYAATPGYKLLYSAYGEVLLEEYT